MRLSVSSLSINTKAKIFATAVLVAIILFVVWFYFALPYQIVRNEYSSDSTPNQVGVTTTLISLIALLPSTLGDLMRQFFFRLQPYRLPNGILRTIHSLLVALSFAAFTFIPSLLFRDQLAQFNILPITIIATVFIATFIWRFYYPLPLNALSRDGRTALNYFGYSDTILHYLKEGKRYAAVQLACREYEVDFGDALTVVCLHETRDPDEVLV